MVLADDHHMLNSSSQDILSGQAFRPFEETWPADTRLEQLRMPERPSAAKAARKLLQRWPSRSRQAKPIGRLA